MNQRKLAVIGVGNMAKSVIFGILQADLPVSEIILYDKNINQYEDLPKCDRFRFSNTAGEAVSMADCVLLAVKPQNYDEVLGEISKEVSHNQKLYISIAAGVSSDTVSNQLNRAPVVRVLPNVPMLIGQGVSLICENTVVSTEDFAFVCDVFRSAGNIHLIDETDMNRMIGVTSSSPAYVFRFINAIYQGALQQELPDRELLNSICDVVIGSALLLKNSSDTPDQLIAKVASKGGTTEKALEKLTDYRFDEAIREAMLACTHRANELGQKK